MNHRLIKLPCLLMIAATLIFTACEKEGPEGPQGAQGPAGPAGPAGPKGDTGVANVIYSGWLDVAFTRRVPQPGDTSYLATINAPKLTNEILNRGDVKVFVNIGTVAQPAVVPLPLDWAVFGVIMTPLFEVGKITLLASDDLSTEGTGNSKSLQYRYILIPGGVSGRTMNIDWNNYEAVKAYLGLRD